MSAVHRRPNLFISHLLADAGYHPVMLGNNSYFRNKAMFARQSVHGSPVTGTVDTAAALSGTLRRYADERTLLVYYVTATHPQHVTPVKLERELGCGALLGLERSRCRYDARARHADEAFGALLEGLGRADLASRSLIVVTADHGEAFEDGWPLQGHTYSAWRRLDTSHGYTVDPAGLHVPLVIAGPGIEPARLPQAVSTLGLVPTLLDVAGLRRVHRLETDPLPVSGGTAHGSELFAYGFCAHAKVTEQGELVWWDQSTCGERRLAASGEVLRDAIEWWHQRRRRSLPAATRADFVSAHSRWIEARLPGRVTMMDLRLAGSTTVRVEADGPFLDYGPAATVRGFRGLEVASEGNALVISADNYEGLFSLAVSPGTRVRVSVEGPSPPALLGGPWQLPYDLAGTWLSPWEDEDLLGAPVAKSTTKAVRLWWEDPSAHEGPGASGIPNVEQILREWGYIR